MAIPDELHGGRAPSLPPQTILITGPTAVGKSEVALHLAERCGGEILSADSMQVYRGLDIGTAKPTGEERHRVPHHLIDVVDPDSPFDVAHYLRLGQNAIRAIIGRGAIPILCGGTGFYLKAWLAGIGSAPPSDPALRAQLESTPLEDLLQELAQADPATFAVIDRRNPRRVVRALEVMRLTRRPFSAQKSAWSDDAEAMTHPRGFVLTRSSEDLRARIGIRVERMFAAGLVDETRALLHRGLEGNPTASQAIGYRQVLEHLRGERSLEDTIRLVQSRTWQLARRQMTWFRHRLPLPMVPLRVNESARETADKLIALMEP